MAEDKFTSLFSSRMALARGLLEDLARLDRTMIRGLKPCGLEGLRK